MAEGYSDCEGDCQHKIAAWFGDALEIAANPWSKTARSIRTANISKQREIFLQA
jgi:hypothetical protein